MLDDVITACFCIIFFRLPLEPLSLPNMGIIVPMQIYLAHDVEILSFSFVRCCSAASANNHFVIRVERNTLTTCLICTR